MISSSIEPSRTRACATLCTASIFASVNSRFFIESPRVDIIPATVFASLSVIPASLSVDIPLESASTCEPRETPCDEPAATPPSNSVIKSPV